MATIMRVGGGLASAGAGKGLYCVELPRSLYYGQAAEWMVKNPNYINDAYSLQIVCNGELWNISSSTYNNGTKNVISRSLSTGEKTYEGTITLSYPCIAGSGTQGGSAMSPICTDGESRIWFCGASAYRDVNGIDYALYEFNVLTKELKTEFAARLGGENTDYYTYFCDLGAIHYSKNYNKVFWFGFSVSRYPKYGTMKYANVVKSQAFDLSTRTWVAISQAGTGLSNTYCYETETGDLYIGGGYYYSEIGAGTSTNIVTAKNTYIYRYSIPNDSFTTIRTDFTQNIDDITNGRTAVFIVGDSVMQINPTHIFVFDPKTGNAVEGQVPTPYGSDINLTGTYRAQYNNVLYLWTRTQDKALIELPLWQNTPADAPIVAKVYKGQKYHALVPFDLLRQGIRITTAQQTATEDIEIKMYDYSSEGGQLLYIET